MHVSNYLRRHGFRATIGVFSLELGAEIALVLSAVLAKLGELESAVAPADDLAGELLVLLSGDPELVLAESWNRPSISANRAGVNPRSFSVARAQSRSRP